MDQCYEGTHFFFLFLSKARPIYERFPDIYVLWWLNFISNPHFLLGMKLDMKKPKKFQADL